MSTKKYDFIIFGATGFTGQYVAEEVSRIAEKEGITWAVAGRNGSKLRSVLDSVQKFTGKSIKDVGVIEAEVSNASSLAAMAKMGKVVLNCVGPYRFYGEPVVKACVENGASHLDISGEIQFLERMQLEYNDQAKRNKVYIVGACGFDSIPADMGTVFLEEKFGDGQVNTVESYLKLIAKQMHGHFGTWQSAIYAIGCAGELKPIRKKLFSQRLPQLKPKQTSRGLLHYSNIVKAWCLAFPGVDTTVVHRSQRHFYETDKKRPVQISAYVQSASFLKSIGMMIAVSILGIFSHFSLGRKLLEKYPEVFSFGTFDHEGPTRKEMEETSFCMTLAGKGWSEKKDDQTTSPEKELVVKVSGPEPGYVATPICMVQAGLVILKEANKLPKDGGVFAPGAAFAKTSIIERLNNHGVRFEIVKNLKSSL